MNICDTKEIIADNARDYIYQDELDVEMFENGDEPYVSQNRRKVSLAHSRYPSSTS